MRVRGRNAQAGAEAGAEVRVRGRADARAISALAVLAAGTLVLTACSGAGSGNAGGADTAAPASATPAFAIDQDFPDPDVLRVGDTYYAYATNNPAANLQYATSTDLETWQPAGEDAFPDLPAWAEAAGRSQYELLTGLGQRFERV